MKILLFKSMICPRCHAVAHHLRTVARRDSTLQIQEIDIMKHPLLALKNRIYFIPTIIINNNRITGIYLSSKQIETFINTCSMQEQ